MISTDLFMELNGDLVWLVDDGEIDYADNIKRSYRNDVYPTTTEESDGSYVVRDLYGIMSKKKDFNPNNYFHSRKPLWRDGMDYIYEIVLKSCQRMICFRLVR